MQKSYSSISKNKSDLNLKNSSCEKFNQEQREKRIEPIMEVESECGNTVKKPSHNKLLGALKRSLCNNNVLTGAVNGFGGDELFSLIDNHKLLNNPILQNELITQELFMKHEEQNNKVSANFNLLTHLRQTVEGENERYVEYAIMRVKKLTKREKRKSIQVYLEKKNNRKRKKFIRYQVRKDLAVKRKRFKGKFVKNNKMNLQIAVQEYMQGELSKNLDELRLT